jgi:hypothetical protein
VRNSTKHTSSSLEIDFLLLNQQGMDEGKAGKKEGQKKDAAKIESLSGHRQKKMQSMNAVLEARESEIDGDSCAQWSVLRQFLPRRDNHWSLLEED